MQETTKKMPAWMLRMLLAREQAAIASRESQARKSPINPKEPEGPKGPTGSSR